MVIRHWLTNLRFGLIRRPLLARGHQASEIPFWRSPPPLLLPLGLQNCGFAPHPRRNLLERPWVDVFGARNKKTESDWAPRTWLLEEKGVFWGPKKPPEAAWAPHTWLLERKG